MTEFIEDDAPAVERLAPAIPSEPIWRLTVREYHEMIRAGILAEGDPVELLDGWLVAKTRKTPPHSVSTHLASRALEDILPEGWDVHAQGAITLATSEPEPDVVIVRGEPRAYVDRHPGPKDVALVVEVADASLQRDRGFKRRLYAQAAIPVYWIVNLVERVLEVYTDPSGPTDQPDYRQQRTFGAAEQVPLVVEGREVGRVTVSALLP
jgi:Uma2 family endonuclease